MNPPKKNLRVIKSISELHEVLGYPEKPKHPLISLVDFSKIKIDESVNDTRTIFSLYLISLKKLGDVSFKYGRQDYDFAEASLLCMAPEQVTIVSNIEGEAYPEGWGLYFHPDVFRTSFLNDKIKEYSFFSYNSDEALHLSDKEKQTLTTVVQTIKEEYSINLDSHSHDLIVSNIEVLLNYCKRYYGRQFITRRNYHKDIVSKFDDLLSNYFDSDLIREQGLPSVKYCAEKLNVSPNYLGDLLKQETGQGALEHIHYQVIERAKNLLLNSDQRVSGVAYSLGFEYPQSFSKLFKKKTGVSPKEYIESALN